MTPIKFKGLDEAAPEHTIFASNTSSLPIGNYWDSKTVADLCLEVALLMPQTGKTVSADCISLILFQSW